MMHVSMDTKKTNQLVAEGKMGATIEGILAKLKPEAAYFYPVDGGRGFTLVVDAADGATLPSLAEPMWLELGATVTAVPVMNAEELGIGLSRLG